MCASRNQFQQTKDQIALIRQSEQPGQWLFTVQQNQALSFQGQGTNGFHEFKHFLLPDIVAHIYYIIDKPQLPLLHSKFQCRTLLITWIGENSNISVADTNKFTSQLSFQDAFTPITAHIVSQNIEQLNKAIDEVLQNTYSHPSFKNTLDVIQNGFIVYTSKERRPTPHIITMVSQRLLSKSMMPGQVEASVQIQNFLFGEKRNIANSPKKQPQRQHLVRMNPRMSEQVEKLQTNIKNMECSMPPSNIFCQKKYEEPSDDLEDNDVDLIQTLLNSIRPINNQADKIINVKKVKSSKNKRTEEVTSSIFMTQPDVQPPNNQIFKQDKVEEVVKIEPKIQEAPKEIQQVQQKKQLVVPEPVKSQEQLEREKNINKLKTQCSIINALTTRFSEKKITKAQEILTTSINNLVQQQDELKIKEVKQQLNKAAMAFLIIEAGKRGVMKKDFVQTLQAVAQFLPQDGDAVLKRLIQGQNQAISFEEIVSQVDSWVGFLGKFFGL